ncbi:MAG: hypothetical protein LBQ35_07330 [Spirochaetaceae bacterium]|jgi:hypothetical protein|nr:hypothetical protein [Spirochaetaceae bacterium]
MRKKRAFVPLCLAVLLSLSGCEDLFDAIGGLYGNMEGADRTERLDPPDPQFQAILSKMSGVWYSHYAGIGRLDGYRIGKIRDFQTLMPEHKQALFHDALTAATSLPNSLYPGSPPGGTTYGNDDYFVFYDSSVYGQADDNSPAKEGWNFGFMGIVRAVNIFNGDPGRGAIIIQYFEHCAPAWDPDIKDGQLPFFGIYYRELSPDIVQMANAVKLAELYAGQKYYTEEATLEDAKLNNSIENEAEYISWGVVIPQDREKN